MTYKKKYFPDPWDCESHHEYHEGCIKNYKKKSYGVK